MACPEQVTRSRFTARLKEITASSRTTYVAVRYMAAVVVGLEALVFARVLGANEYGSYAIIPQVAALMVFVTLGSNAGYVYAHFRRTGPELDHYYLAAAVAQFLAGALLAVLIVGWLRPYFLLGVLLFVIQVPYLLTEPMLRVRNYFTVTALGRGLPALLTLALAGAYVAVTWQSGPFHIGLRPALALMVSGNMIGYCVYYAVLVRKEYLPFKPADTVRAIGSRETWRSYWREVLVPGLPLHASTIIIIVFQNVDRLFIAHYRAPTALGVYSLAWQLSQGALLMLSSMNLVSGVRVGERMGASGPELRAELTRQFRLTALAASLGIVALVGGTVVLNLTIYRDYTDLVLITVLLSSGYFALNVVASIIGLLFYQGRAKQLTLGYLAVLVSSLAGNIAAIHWGMWYGVPVAFSSLSLIVLNIWFAIYTFGLARRLPHSSALDLPA